MSRARRVAAAVTATALASLGAALWWPHAHEPAPAPPSAAAQVVAGRVALASGAGPVPAGATVVVFAYAIGGPQAPLAVWQRPASALPQDFRLDDSLGPPGGPRLSQVRELVVGARLGPGGEALAQVGDWLAGSQTVTPGSLTVQLVLQPPPK